MYGPPPGPPPMQPRPSGGVHGAIVFLLCVVCAVGGLAVGCVGGMGLASAPDPTSSPKAAAASETPTTEAPATTEPSTSPSDSPTPTPSKSSASPSPTPKIRVPNVVGKNHQEAQDIMQRAGLWGLAERTPPGRAACWCSTATGRSSGSPRNDGVAGQDDHAVQQEDRRIAGR